jgi:hypothetical protein
MVVANLKQTSCSWLPKSYGATRNIGQLKSSLHPLFAESYAIKSNLDCESKPILFFQSCVHIQTAVCRMEKDVVKYKEEMGETGAGIEKEDEIDLSLDNRLTEAWGMSTC